MFNSPDSPFLVPFDGSFRVADTLTRHAHADLATARARLIATGRRLRNQQRRLTANDTWSLLLVFQGMDAAGKDGTIRAVLREADPSSFVVHNFRRPTLHELDRDFLWRTTRCLPERGRISVFNRSQYEEVLIVRVHPEILDGQQLPPTIDRNAIWDQRLESIRNQELHLANNGMIILKFWLNVSRDEQKERFLARINTAENNWKFNPADIDERQFWDEYMRCYEDALNATSRPWAPWYAIPADDKPFMRATVAEIVVNALASLNMKYPVATPDDRAHFAAARKALAKAEEPR